MRSFQLLSISASERAQIASDSRIVCRKKTRVKFLDQSTLLNPPSPLFTCILLPLLPLPSAAAVTPLPAVPDHTQWEDCGIAN